VPHEIWAHVRQPRLGQRRRRLGTSASVVSLHVGASAPRTVAFEHAEQSRDENALRAAALRRRLENGSHRAGLWAGVTEIRSRRACACGAGPAARPARANVRHHGAALLQLRDWLPEHSVTHVAMEAWSLLEAGVLRARGSGHVACWSTPRTSSRSGAQDRRGGLRVDRPVAGARTAAGSFVPPAPIRELRDLTRHRKGVDPRAAAGRQSCAQAACRMPHQLASVATDILGQSGGRC